MLAPSRGAAVVLGGLIAVGCASTPTAAGRGAEPTQGASVRSGPQRTDIAYADPQAAVKQILFDRVNADRRAHGLPALRYDSRAAKVGDAFCQDLLASGSVGHHDSQGRAPYLRWTQAGGVDYHAQNVSSFTSGRDALGRDIADVLLELQHRMMAELPPDDSHRRTILTRELTHLGIGLAVSGGRLRMSQELTRVAFEWIESPRGPLRTGDVATVQALPLPGLEVPIVEVGFEPFGAARRLEAGGSYTYPPPALTLRPRLTGDFTYASGGNGDFDVHPGGRVVVRVPLSLGPGRYYVMLHTRQRRTQAMMTPGSVILVEAEPATP